MGLDEADLPGASVWEEELWTCLRRHLEAERAIATEYAALADRSGPDVAFLINLIMDDERRHHIVLEEIANALRSDVELRPHEPAVPHLSRRIEGSKELAAATKAFARIEREDARELRRLQRELRPVRDTTLWSLLVRLMELDTKKHLEILAFIADRARG